MNDLEKDVTAKYLSSKYLLTAKNSFMQTPTDTQLHEQARKRVDFKIHLFVYFVVIGMLWIIWFFTNKGYPWPVWPMAGWGIGVIFHYAFDYRSSRFLSEEEEYQKLKKRVQNFKASE